MTNDYGIRPELLPVFDLEAMTIAFPSLEDGNLEATMDELYRAIDCA